MGAARKVVQSSCVLSSLAGQKDHSVQESYSLEF